MGQTSSSLTANDAMKYQEFVKNYQFLRKIKDPRYGDISILQDKFTKEYVALREILAKNSKDFENDLNSLKTRSKITHPNIIKIIGYTSKSEENFCASMHKILMIVEYLDNDLDKEITFKRNRNSFYKEDQLWYLIENVVKALQVFQKNNIAHEDIKPNSIFISKMGLYKIAQNNIAGPFIPAYHQRVAGVGDGRTYLSPALLIGLQKEDNNPRHNPWKSDVFALGMTVLHAATLRSSDDLYNWNNNTLDIEELAERLASLRPRYSEKFQDFLQTMLELKEGLRPDFIQLESRLFTATESNERLNPTPSHSISKPRVHEDVQDISEEALGDNDSRHTKNSSIRVSHLSENGPYFQKSVDNITNRQEGRISPIAAEENSLPYHSQDSVHLQKSNLSPDIRSRASEKSQGRYTKESISKENNNSGLQGRQEVNAAVNRSYGSRDNTSNTKAYPPQNPFEVSDFALNNSSTQVSDAHQRYNYSSGVNRDQERAPVITLNQVPVVGQQDQGLQNNKLVAENKDSLPKSLISDEVAKIISEFRRKMETSTPIDTNYSDYSKPKDSQKENMKTQGETGYSQEKIEKPRYKDNLQFSDNSPYQENYEKPTMYNQNYTNFASQQVFHMGAFGENNPQLDSLQGSKSKDYNYQPYSKKVEAPVLSNRPLNSADTSPYNYLDPKSNLVERNSDSNALNANNPLKKSYEIQNFSSYYADNHSLNQQQGTYKEPLSMEWRQSYSQQGFATGNNQIPDAYLSNGYSSIEKDLQDKYTSIRSHQSQYDSINAGNQNAPNSYEKYLKNDYQGNLYQQTNYPSQMDKMVTQSNSGLYQQNQYSQQKFNDQYSSEKFSKLYSGFESINQDNQANAYSSINSTQNRITYRDNEEEVIREEYPDGSVYEGQKKNGLRHGKGTFYYADGGTYTGNWFGGSMEGYGTLYYAGGAKAYEGEWKEDKFHGKGTVYNEMPSQLLGEFDLTNFDNVGDFWVRYEGEFVNDNKEGRGVLLLSNGEKYQGQFKEDMVEGVGAFYTISGRVIQGEWWQNKLIKPLI